MSDIAAERIEAAAERLYDYTPMRVQSDKWDARTNDTAHYWAREVLAAADAVSPQPELPTAKRHELESVIEASFDEYLSRDPEVTEQPSPFDLASVAVTALDVAGFLHPVSPQPEYERVDNYAIAARAAEQPTAARDIYSGEPWYRRVCSEDQP